MKTQQEQDIHLVFIDGTRYVYFGEIVDSELRFSLRDSSSNVIEKKISDWNDGEWHNLIFTKWGNTQADIEIYLDGVASGIVKTSDTLTGAGVLTKDFFIGAINSDGSPVLYFNGSLKDIRIYNESLTASQVEMLYNNSEWLTEGNFTIMDNLTFRARSYNGTGWTAEATANEDYTVAITQSYASAIFEGEKANYEFNITKGGQCIKHYFIFVL